VTGHRRMDAVPEQVPPRVGADRIDAGEECQARIGHIVEPECGRLGDDLLHERVHVEGDEAHLRQHLQLRERLLQALVVERASCAAAPTASRPQIGYLCFVPVGEAPQELTADATQSLQTPRARWLTWRPMNQSIRDYLKGRIRWCLAFALGGWILIALGGGLAQHLPEGIPRPALPLVGFAVFFGAIIALQRSIRCPKCRARLGQTIGMALAFNFGSGPQVNFCPFCGVHLDEPRPAGGDAGAAQNPIKS